MGTLLMQTIDLTHLGDNHELIRNTKHRISMRQ